MRADALVIGAGIVGLATACQLQRQLGNAARVVVVERERAVAQHQSSHNSGVLHAGIYYKPGSMRARLCGRGIHMMYDFLETHNLPVNRCGKLIVAAREDQLADLHQIYANSVENKIPGVRLVDSKEMQEIDPLARGIKAIWSPITGVCDYGQIARQLAQNFTQAGGTILTDFETVNIRKLDVSSSSSDRESLLLLAARNGQEVIAPLGVACAGLQADRVATLSGASPTPRIIPVRGSFKVWHSESVGPLPRTNIYPVPDRRFPFLGVHLTPSVDGCGAKLGPSAVASFHRHAYVDDTVTGDPAHWAWVRDTTSMLSYPGTWRLGWKYAGWVFAEWWRDLSSAAFLQNAAHHLGAHAVPPIQQWDNLHNYCGIRALALGRNGEMMEDFVWEWTPHLPLLHVRNAPSPAATSSLAIAEEIVEEMLKRKTV